MKAIGSSWKAASARAAKANKPRTSARLTFGCNERERSVSFYMNTVNNLRIVGQATSPGLVVGQTFVYHNPVEALSTPRSISHHEIEQELEQVERAVETVRDDLHVSARRIETDTG